jgi:lipid-A-disaccharide synthase
MGAGERDLLVVAGETSGDLHAARCLTELRRLAPAWRTWGMGGPELRAAGLETLYDCSEIAVVGIAEALRVLPRARRVFRGLLAEVDRRGTKAALLIDSPEFNLRLARALRRRSVKIVYYISPQIWAWRRHRVHAIRRLVDRMLVLFPFEVDFYRRYGVDVVEVGHPLVDEVPHLPQIWEETERPGLFRLTLLPGSRVSEVEANAPPMLDAAARLAAELPVAVRWIQAPGLSDEMVASALAGRQIEIEMVREERFAALAGSHLALCASGTATLEVGLLGTPMIVVYRLARGTYWLGRMMVRLPHISLVNLVLGRGVVPEMLQREASGKRIAAEARALLTDAGRLRAMRAGLAELRPRLGAKGASRRAAEAMLETLGS